jgi:hypothetical protein
MQSLASASQFQVPPESSAKNPLDTYDPHSFRAKYGPTDRVLSPPPLSPGGNGPFRPPSVHMPSEVIPERPEQEQIGTGGEELRDLADMSPMPGGAGMINVAMSKEMEAAGLRPAYYPQSEQVREARNQRMSHVHEQRHTTIDTQNDHDLNNRDDDMTAYSQFGRKSVGVASKASKMTQQIDSNMQFIASRIDHDRQKFPASNALSPKPSGPLSKEPPTTDQRSQYDIPIQTEKSFFKRTSHQQMTSTGMQGAQPMKTGSSFYNATMAKTEQQKLAQQETYERQLLKIFSSDKQGDDVSGLEESKDSLDARQRDQPSEPQQKYVLPLDDTDYYEKASNINIAQSVDASQNKSFVSHANLQNA